MTAMCLMQEQLSVLQVKLDEEERKNLKLQQVEWLINFSTYHTHLVTI